MLSGCTLRDYAGHFRLNCNQNIYPERVMAPLIRTSSLFSLHNDLAPMHVPLLLYVESRGTQSHELPFCSHTARMTLPGFIGRRVMRTPTAR